MVNETSVFELLKFDCKHIKMLTDHLCNRGYQKQAISLNQETRLTTYEKQG